jgi:hypothetical protein
MLLIALDCFQELLGPTTTENPTQSHHLLQLVEKQVASGLPQPQGFQLGWVLFEIQCFVDCIDTSFVVSELELCLEESGESFEIIRIKAVCFEVLLKGCFSLFSRVGVYYCKQKSDGYWPMLNFPSRYSLLPWYVRSFRSSL